MNIRSLLSFALLGIPALAQSVAIFPDEYVAVPEGPLNSPNYPLAFGTSRVEVLYEAIDLAIPSGHTITRLGFRQDATLTALDTGRTLQLEVRMGYTNNNVTTMVTNFDNNYAAPPTTVFGPSAFVLPNLRDANAPLTNGQFFVTLTTPFVYAPAAGQNLLVEYRVFGSSAGGASFNYRLDRADYYSPRTYGPAGCQHSSGGTANLTMSAVRPGLTLTTSIATGPANAPAVLAVNLGNPLLPTYDLTSVFAGISATCLGQINPINMATLGGSTGTTGATSWAFAIPNNPVFADYVISTQAVFLDFFAPGGLVVSNGGQVLTGANPRCAVLAVAGAPTVVTTGTKTVNYGIVSFFEHQ